MGGLRGVLDSKRDPLLSELKALNVTWNDNPPKTLERLLGIWRLLSFYDRWLAQIQERVVQLSF